MASPVSSQYAARDYKSDLKPIWCPGCGDYGVVQAIYRALEAIGRPHVVDPEDALVKTARGLGISFGD